MIQEDLPSFQYLVLIEGEIVLLHQLHSHRAEQYQEAVIFSFGPRKWMILLPLDLGSYRLEHSGRLTLVPAFAF